MYSDYVESMKSGEGSHAVDLIVQDFACNQQYQSEDRIVNGRSFSLLELLVEACAECAFWNPDM